MSATPLLLLRLLRRMLLRRRRLRRLLRRRLMLLLLMRSRARRRRRGACWQVRCVVEPLERGEKGRRLAAGSNVCTNRGLKPRRGVPVQTHAREAAEARSGGLRSSGTAVVERKLSKPFQPRCADLRSAWSFLAVRFGKTVSGASAKAAVVANADGFKAAARSPASSSSTSSAASRAGSSVAAAAKASQSMMPTESINRMSYTHARLKERQRAASGNRSDRNEWGAAGPGGRPKRPCPSPLERASPPHHTIWTPERRECHRLSV
jgi:hypothetical protein